MMPTHNFTATRFAPAPGLNAHAYAAAYHPRQHGCKGCHIRCKKIATRSTPGVPIPEFEAMSHFTALVGLADIQAVTAANQACNQLGMDSISAASTLACFKEITGRTLTPETLMTLLEDMALDRGDGRDLKHGAARYARSMGQPSAAMTVKGLELFRQGPDHQTRRGLQCRGGFPDHLQVHLFRRRYGRICQGVFRGHRNRSYCQDPFGRR
jgi:aldehyde:ferredoxin oxidoreductase